MPSTCPICGQVHHQRFCPYCRVTTVINTTKKSEVVYDRYGVPDGGQMDPDDSIAFHEGA